MLGKAGLTGVGELPSFPLGSILMKCDGHESAWGTLPCPTNVLKVASGTEVPFYPLCCLRSRTAAKALL